MAYTLGLLPWAAAVSTAFRSASEPGGGGSMVSLPLLLALASTWWEPLAWSELARLGGWYLPGAYRCGRPLPACWSRRPS